MYHTTLNFHSMTEAKSYLRSHYTQGSVYCKHFQFLDDLFPYHLQHDLSRVQLRQKVNQLTSILNPNQPYNVPLIQCIVEFEASTPNPRKIPSQMDREGIINTIKYLVKHIDSCAEELVEAQKLPFEWILIATYHMQAISQVFDDMKRRHMFDEMEVEANLMIKQEYFSKLLSWSTNVGFADILCACFDVSVRCLAWLKMDNNVQGYLEMNNIVMKVLGNPDALCLDPVVHFIRGKCRNKMELCQAIKDLLKIDHFKNNLLNSKFDLVLQRIIMAHRKGELQQIMFKLDQCKPFATCQTIGKHYEEIAANNNIDIITKYKPDRGLLLSLQHTSDNFDGNFNVSKQINHFCEILQKLNVYTRFSAVEQALFFRYSKTDIVLDSMVSMLSQNLVLDGLMVEKLLNNMFEVVHNNPILHKRKILELYDFFVKCVASAIKYLKKNGNNTSKLNEMIEYTKIILIYVIKLKQNNIITTKYYHVEDNLYAYYIALKCAYIIFGGNTKKNIITI